MLLLLFAFLSCFFSCQCNGGNEVEEDCYFESLEQSAQCDVICTVESDGYLACEAACLRNNGEAQTGLEDFYWVPEGRKAASKKILKVSAHIEENSFIYFVFLGDISNANAGRVASHVLSTDEVTEEEIIKSSDLKSTVTSYSARSITFLANCKEVSNIQSKHMYLCCVESHVEGVYCFESDGDPGFTVNLTKLNRSLCAPCGKPFYTKKTSCINKNHTEIPTCPASQKAFTNANALPAQESRNPGSSKMGDPASLAYKRNSQPTCNPDNQKDQGTVDSAPTSSSIQGSHTDAYPESPHKRTNKYHYANRIAAASVGVACNMAVAGDSLSTPVGCAMSLLQHSPILVSSIAGDHPTIGRYIKKTSNLMTVCNLGYCMCAMVSATTPGGFAAGALGLAMTGVRLITHQGVQTGCLRWSQSNPQAAEMLEPWLHTAASCAMTSLQSKADMALGRYDETASASDVTDETEQLDGIFIGNRNETVIDPGTGSTQSQVRVVACKPGDDNPLSLLPGVLAANCREYSWQELAQHLTFVRDELKDYPPVMDFISQAPAGNFTTPATDYFLQGYCRGWMKAGGQNNTLPNNYLRYQCFLADQSVSEHVLKSVGSNQYIPRGDVFPLVELIEDLGKNDTITSDKVQAAFAGEPAIAAGDYTFASPIIQDEIDPTELAMELESCNGLIVLSRHPDQEMNPVIVLAFNQQKKQITTVIGTEGFESPYFDASSESEQGHWPLLSGRLQDTGSETPESNKSLSRVRRFNDGEVDNGRHPYVVRYENFDHSACTAAVISSGWALTAKHCTRPNSHDGPGALCMYSESGCALDAGMRASFIFRSYLNENIYSDVALLHFDLFYVSPRELSSIPRLDFTYLTDKDIDQEGVCIGYGGLGYKAPAPRVKSCFIQKIGVYVEDQEKSDGSGRYIFNNLVQVGSTLASEHRPGLADTGVKGDSGGPLLMKNSTTVVGVLVTSGKSVTNFNLDGSLDSVSYYDPIDRYESFILKNMGPQWGFISDSVAMEELIKLADKPLCRVVETDREERFLKSLRLGVMTKEGMGSKCKVYDPAQGQVVVKPDFEAAYQPLSSKSNNGGEPKVFWQALSETGEIPDNALPAYIDYEGGKYYPCISVGQKSSTLLKELANFPGTLFVEAPTESSREVSTEKVKVCQNLKLMSRGNSPHQIMVLSYRVGSAPAEEVTTTPSIPVTTESTALSTEAAVRVILTGAGAGVAVGGTLMAVGCFAKKCCSYCKYPNRPDIESNSPNDKTSESTPMVELQRRAGAQIAGAIVFSNPNMSLK